MRPHRRTLVLVVLTLLLAACSPGVAEPDAVRSVPMTASSEPDVTASPTRTPHDMAATDGMGHDGTGESARVEISSFAFAPVELTISAGTEVIFTNRDSAPHTVTAGTDDEPMPDVFDSGLLEQGESFTFVFDEPGTFMYFCDRHPPMEGSITVEG